MTNWDRIRKAETVEQLAAFLGECMPDVCPPGMLSCKSACFDCLNCWCAWLAQEEK